MKAMEVHFPPDVEKELIDLAAESGCEPAELLQDALAGYLDEKALTQNTFKSRHDDLKSGRENPIDGEEAYSCLKANTEAQRNRPA